ncbi:MAG: Na/Pi cotransporter family protein [Planctomycetes bacterium]|nr:Na/Pi cotransporter family protein [Planctomycetota bacterium]
MELLGGLALFLFGMELLSQSLKAVAGDRMKSILTRLTSNRLLGVLTGGFVTAVIQSSSVTTVLVVGFISAGLMSLSQAVGVILGADIGTTITAQIIAFKITHYALLLVAIGYGVVFFSRGETWKQHGKGLLGLGLVFFGMHLMGETMVPLRDYPPFLAWMAEMEHPLLGILAGAAFTALVQSSSATTGVVIVLASQDLVSLPAGIALIFGANIGTCVTALLASIGRPREAVRAAVVHIVFKVVGVLIWLAFIPELAALVGRLSEQAPRQIAHAHTVFNVANTLVFLPLAGVFVRLVEWLVPDRPMAEEEIVRAKYLDEDLMSTPSLALDRARLEILHMGDTARDMLQRILPALTTGSEQDLREIEILDDRVDALHGFIVTYLGRISRTRLTDGQTAEFLKLMEAANSLENIGDVVETNLVQLGRSRIEQRLRISDATRRVLQEFHATVVRALDQALLAVTQKNPEAARAVLHMKPQVRALASSAALHEAKRLVAEEPNRLPAYTLEIDTLENLKRVYYFCRRMARAGVPEAADLS